MVCCTLFCGHIGREELDASSFAINVCITFYSKIFYKKISSFFKIINVFGWAPIIGITSAAETFLPQVNSEV
jgi:hypothetical protein